jgi:hypothetical protein
MFNGVESSSKVRKMCNQKKSFNMCHTENEFLQFQKEADSQAFLQHENMVSLNDFFIKNYIEIV